MHLGAGAPGPALARLTSRANPSTSSSGAIHHRDPAASSHHDSAYDRSASGFLRRMDANAREIRSPLETASRDQGGLGLWSRKPFSSLRPARLLRNAASPHDPQHAAGSQEICIWSCAQSHWSRQHVSVVLHACARARVPTGMPESWEAVEASQCLTTPCSAWPARRNADRAVGGE